MRSRRDLSDPNQPPPEWVTKLCNHYFQVHTVRMFWRRGRRAYTPLVGPDRRPIDVRDELDIAFWEANEWSETYFEWEPDMDASWEERRAAAEEVVGELWRIAVDWTRWSGGMRCDFLLVGYGVHDETRFEVGKQCRLDGAPVGASTDGDRNEGAVEIIVGDVVLRVWDVQGLRTVLEALD